jgi:hypothetical protein
LRYLAFPGLLTLLSICLVILKLVRSVVQWPYKRAVLGLGALVLFVGPVLLIAHHHQMEAQIKQEPDLMAVMGSVPPADNAALALQCIDQAAAQYPLADGVATYWHARPVYFASDFKHFLAQVSPWHPRSGYLYWGNNGLDFSYQDGNRERPRHYNYILATNDEMRFNLWGSLVNDSSIQLRCAKHTVLFFAKPSVLENYLFPFGQPFDIDATGRVFKPNDHNRQWVAGPYWGTDLFTLVGVREGLSIRATGQAGALVYGPYIGLPVGTYRLVVKGHLVGSGKEIGSIDVAAYQGAKTLASAMIIPAPTNSQEIAQLDFHIERPVSDAEFRVLINPNTTGMFTSYELIKLPSAALSK